MTTQTQYERQFIMQSRADDTEWRKGYEARKLQRIIHERTVGVDDGITNRKIEERSIIFTQFGGNAQIVAPTDGKSMRAIYAPNMAIINIPMIISS